MILILGGGYVGSEFAKRGGMLYRRSERDYTREAVFEAMLDALRPLAVVNCAGMTGRPNIDECETKRGECVQANVALPAMLSRVAKRNGVPFVHISSGCIYQGGPYTEVDKPDFGGLSFYSLCKAIAEEAVEGYTLRIRMPFGMEAHPRSFLTKIRSYPKLISHANSLTFIPDLVEATHALLDARAPYGIYNVVNSGPVSHAEIVETFRHEGHEWNPKFITDDEFRGMVKAPRSNCVLTNEKICRYHTMPSTRSRLHEAARHQLERLAA